MTVPKAGCKSVRVSVSSTSIPSASMIQVPTRTLLKTILKTLLKIIFKLWKWASSFVVVFFFAAWFYGGILPYFIFVAAFLKTKHGIFGHSTYAFTCVDGGLESLIQVQVPEEKVVVGMQRCLSYHITDYFLYQPDMPGDSRLFVESPARYTMHFEDVWIHTKDRVKIHGYLIKQNRLSNRNVPTIVFFHGNAGNIGHRLENVKLFYYQLNCNVLMVEYRGYGRSEGAPSEKGLYSDAQAAFEYIDSREDLDSKKIILFGRSLGGAVAIDLAARCDFRDRVAALIVENTFTSIPAIAKELFKFAILKWVPNFCYKNRFESLQKIGSVACPTLFISGTNDELLPPSMTNELYSKCSAGVKLLHRFPGGHNDTWICKDYIQKISEFIEEEVIAGKRKPAAKYQAYSDNIV